MKQEDKELLLRDLCARLPYEVKVFYKYKTWDSEKFVTSIRLADGKIALSSKFEKEGDWYPIEEAGEILIKPYLRPMLNMTDNEKEEAYNSGLAYIDSGIYTADDGTKILYGCKSFQLIPGTETDDWLNAHHFDFRGLIDKGLALEAPKSMYKN